MSLCRIKGLRADTGAPRRVMMMESRSEKAGDGARCPVTEPSDPTAEVFWIIDKRCLMRQVSFVGVLSGHDVVRGKGAMRLIDLADGKVKDLAWSKESRTGLGE